MTRVRRTLLAGIALATVAVAANARPPMFGPGGREVGPPAFMRHLHPPRLVLQNRDAIGLTTEQRRAIVQAIGEARRTLAALSRKREPAAAALAEATAAARVDEETALARAAELMAVEQEIKRAHLRLLVRVKNQLTPEQQEKLHGLQGDWRAERRRRWRDRPGPDAPDDR